MKPGAGEGRAAAGEGGGVPGPPEWVVHDEPARCPYLEEEVARLPLRLPSRPLTAEELAERLRRGERRQSLLLYRPSCPRCRACEAIRLDVREFSPDRTQRRVYRRGERAFEMRIGRPVASQERVRLYNRHKRERGLLVGDDEVDLELYRDLFVPSCVDTLEITYWTGGRLAGVAICDRAADALSAVYFYFDPDLGRLSPGVYSILKQVELCGRWRLRYLYLGLYVRGCSAMEYKVRYLPHERLIAGEWRRFERP